MSSISFNPPSALDSLYLVGKSTILELLRRKDFYVLFILMAIYVAGVLVVALVGIENPSTAAYIMNFGITMAFYAAHILALILVVKQIPDEIENRTLYPLLSKPLSRTLLIIGKWGACAIGGFVSFLVLFLMGWVPTPKLDAYSFGLLTQAVILTFVSLSVLTSIGMLLSTFMPKGVNLVLTGLIFFFGAKVAGFIRAHSMESGLENIVRWASAYVPDFSIFNLMTRYTDGIGPLAIGEFFAIILVGASFTAFCLVISIFIFNRKPL